jgi:hypothetical protein
MYAGASWVRRGSYQPQDDEASPLTHCHSPLPNIATGGYANVYRADDAITGTSYVLKRMTVFKDNLLVAGCAR